MINKIYAWYGSLPKTIQVLLMAVESAALIAAVQWFQAGGLCFTKACLKALGGTVLAAIGLAIHNWLKSSPFLKENLLSPSVRAIGILFLFLALGSAAHAQLPKPIPALPSDVYSLGLAFNPEATPSIAGNATWAHLLPTDTSTYSFTSVDLLPVAGHPSTVSTNIATGFAQKVFNLGSIPVYMTTGAGVAVTGQNVGWDWKGGIDLPIKIRGNWGIAPNLRYLKSSVSNGAGFQLIGGVNFYFSKQ